MKLSSLVIPNYQRLVSEKAISASKLVNIRNTKNADRVLKLLRTHGFTQSDIARLISKQPHFLSRRVDTNLGPKIEFLQSLGFVGPALPKFLRFNYQILLYSLKNQIMPAISSLKSVVHTNENVIHALKRSWRFVFFNFPKTFWPNISTLRANRVPELHIERLVGLWLDSVLCNVDLFKEIIDEAKAMGFDPGSKSFILGIACISRVSKSKRERKLELLRSLGWSETELGSALTVQPMLMLCSEEKIRTIMHFLVNKVGLMPSDVAMYPNVFLLSLERNIIPRCSVLNLLMSKGLVKKNFCFLGVLTMGKARFEKKFVTLWKEDCPEVIKAYEGEIKFQGFVN
ncbi:hypothetical protein Tsubulata_034077 [Turnera subulata]|uniref:Uncharacterized protein n=1 Tax=Turnera subulata TaxID=218843 RepID=A0A9Q0G1X3_9ROSI|nr:hypothetical protein Tsubulata_034077 [Turnera subulata]